MESSAQKIFEAAVAAPPENTLILLGHNGPTGSPNIKVNLMLLTSGKLTVLHGQGWVTVRMTSVALTGSLVAGTMVIQVGPLISASNLKFWTFKSLTLQFFL